MKPIGNSHAAHSDTDKHPRKIADDELKAALTAARHVIGRIADSIRVNGISSMTRALISNEWYFDYREAHGRTLSDLVSYEYHRENTNDDGGVRRCYRSRPVSTLSQLELTARRLLTVDVAQVLREINVAHGSSHARRLDEVIRQIDNVVTTHAPKPNIITAHVAASRYTVSKRTLSRDVAQGKLTDHRPENHAANAPILLDESQVANLHAKKARTK